MNCTFTKEVERDGARYLVRHLLDEITGPPWDRDEGCGIVASRLNEHVTEEWLFGKRLLVERRRSALYYDIVGSIARATEEKWGPDDVAAAVEADYELLRGYATNNWWYMGIEVVPLTDRGDELRSYARTLWGIESCAGGTYFSGVEDDLIQEIRHEKEEYEKTKAASVKPVGSDAGAGFVDDHSD